MSKIKDRREPAGNKNTLNTKQQYFLELFMNPNSETFGNMTRSYMKAYNTNKESTASTGGSTLLRNPKIITEYDRLCNEYGLGSKVRLNTLSSIVTGNYKQKTVKKHYEYKDIAQEDGSTKRKKVLVSAVEEEKTPTAREAAHAIDVVEKISLAHKKAGLTELQQLSDSAKQVLSKMKDVTPDEDDAILLRIAESEIE